MPHVKVVTFEVEEGKTEELLGYLKALKALAMKDSGWISYDIYFNDANSVTEIEITEKASDKDGHSARLGGEIGKIAACGKITINEYESAV